MWRKRLLSFQDNVTVEVRNLDRALDWYREKLGFRVPSQKSENTMPSSHTQMRPKQVRGPETGMNRGHPPIIFAPKIEAAPEDLSSRGVSVGPIQNDSGGNRFFHFQDIEGNTVEICKET
jgi:catechol 2,3-dioxygenase-like lactoylglutathione lyase family enzyme